MAAPSPPTPPAPGGGSFFRRKHDERPVPAPGLEPGKVVGDFRLRSLLGQGGMGQVWEAQQVSLARDVAVKFVRPERVTEHQLELFAREARAGGRLSHPGIVSVYGHGKSDDLAWIAMELVPGAWDLRDFLDEISRGDEVPAGYDTKVAEFVARIADAVQAAHEAGVIHRDLKPQNVMITEEDRPKVTDFGLARIVDESALSVTGEFAGTYFYMSPEQVAAKRTGIDHRTDIFSLGIVLYEMLSLVRPFRGDTEHQVAQQILVKEAPDPRTLRSRIPRDLAVIAGKCLEKDPDRRYPTMAELAADLRRWLGNEPILATPPTRLDRTVKWCKRNPTKSVSAALVSVALVVIGFLFADNVRQTALAERRAEQLADANLSLENQTAIAEERAEDLAASNLSLEAKTAEALDNARIARENAKRADREAEAATRRADEVLRLSALQELEDLLAEADALWPAHPELVAAYESWIERAAALVAGLPEHEAKRSELRARALPRSGEQRLRERETHARYGRWNEVLARMNELFEELPQARSVDDARGMEEELARLESERAELDLELDERRDWRFGAEESEARWWEKQLTKLNEGLRGLDENLLDPDAVTAAHGWSVARRLGFARTIAENSVTAPEVAHRWSEAIAAISGSANYGGLELTPQLGLTPIGPDPDSGLWEFAHLQTGEPAVRDANGRLALTEETGLVFALIPGGPFAMGAQSSHPNGPNYDPHATSDEGPVHEVQLSAYFLSKYEMTQGQWARMTGVNPSFYRPPGGLAPTLLHPVEQVSWTECMSLLERLGLSLPSEAQWERGARAGTSTVWWTGQERESLRGRVNLADRTAARAGATWSAIADWPDLQDGGAVHTEVGFYPANALGLHDVAGNTWEWCLDGYDSDAYRGVRSQDPVVPWEGSAPRVARGGSFSSTAVNARSAYRDNGPPENRDDNLGLRPARRITP